MLVETTILRTPGAKIWNTRAWGLREGKGVRGDREEGGSGDRGEGGEGR